MTQSSDAGRSAPQSRSAAPDALHANAAQCIGAYSNVLDIGAGRADFAGALPEGCDYRPCSPQDAASGRIAQASFGNGGPADVVTLLDGLDRLEDPAGMLRRLRDLDCPLVFAWSAAGDPPAELETMLGEAGFWLPHRVNLGPGQQLFKASPGAPAPLPARPRKVLVLSYYNDPNFGDRLGYHIVNSLVPAGSLVTHASVRPWNVPDEDFDLLILGIGNSLNAATVARAELHRLVERVPHTLGVFGTQYRYQYRELIDAKLMDRLLGNLTTWWARYEEDIQAFGRGRTNVRHLGDFLISAFPLATPTDSRTLVIPPEIKAQDVALDRLIQQIQAYRRVSTARIHPMLCALTSAEELAYQEQQEDPHGKSSGKFRSQLYDIFGRTFPEDRFFAVDKEAVARYKLKVEANMGELRAQIAELLA